MTPDPIVWNGFTQSALDAAYNNMAAVPEARDILAALTARSEQTRRKYAVAVDLRYGPMPRQTIDLLAGGGDRPLFVFIHGGYWLRNAKDMFSAVTEGALAHGFDAALIGYTLAPDARISDIVQECEAAIAALPDMARQHGLAGRNMVVGGWSAGGHLASRMLERPEVTAAVAVSGLFDLEPIRHCDLNAILALSDDEALVQSPIRRLDRAGKPILVTYGQAELPELQRQSESYARLRTEHGLPTRTLPLPGFDHFSILDQLAKPDGAIAQALAEFRKPAAA